MKNKLILIILSAILFVPAFSEDREFRRGLHTREVPGRKGRPYDLYIPKQYDPARPWPVVLVLHGGGGSSEHARKITCPDGDINSPKCLDALADREGFIVVYPNGTPNNSFLPKFRTWNATGGINGKYRCIGGTACMENVDDIGYFRNLLDDLSKAANIDQDRIYATGISNGGAMAHRLACELSDRIAAIAPVAAGNQYEAVFGCKPKRPVPALEIHGLKDAQWPYEGGYGKPVFGQPRIAEREEYKKPMVPIRPSMANWAKRNNCATDPTIENFGSVIKETYTKCKDAADVVHYAIKDSGHTWPQGYQYFDESGVGKTSQDINANEVIWEFFKRYPRGGGGEKTPFTLGPGDRSFTLMHGGLERRYLAHIPSSYDGKAKMPIVIAFHGGGANPELIDKEFGGMNAKADKEGFIAVYPYGHKCIDVPGKNMYCWNADSLFRLRFVNYKVDDVDFINAMIEKLSQDFLIDEERVYATGASNGAWMAYAAACGLSAKIAAIAPIAGGLALESCAPYRPVSIIHFHGTADPGWPYYGGGSCWTDSIRPPISKTLSKWRGINQCSAVSKSTYQNGDASCETSACSNSEITFCTIKGGGHTVPGGYSFPIEKLMPWDEDCALGSAGRGVGKVSSDIIALDAMWDFFKNHPRVGAAEDAPSALGPGDYDFSFEHGGYVRKYRVHVPPLYNKSKPSAAILVLHGGGGSMEAMNEVTLTDSASDKYSFLAVYPQGIGNEQNGKILGTWNAGECCGKAMQENVDDVGFISKIIDRIGEDFGVDKNRIYVTGHSNGAQMSYRLACELSEKIAAIAPVGGQGALGSCDPKRYVPIMHIHGTEDLCSKYNGGTTGGCFQEYLNDLLGTNIIPYTWEVKSIPDYIDEWRKRNNAEGDSEITYSKGNAACETWGKDTDSEVTLCTVQGMGHTWPGGRYGAVCNNPDTRACKLWKKYVGDLSSDIIANDAMWDFFKKHPRAGAGEESPSALGPGDYDFSLEHDGLARTYKVHVPASYDSKNQTPVVLNFHGGYGNAEAAERQTEMAKTSDREGFILVYPEAVIGAVGPKGARYQHWNGGPRAESDKSQEIDDVGFISALIDKLEKDFSIDSERIYATGISNGGTMVYRLACQLSDRIAAIAPVEANQLDIKCNSARPVPIMHFHGLADRFVPYNGGVSPELPDVWRPVETTISEWKERNACSVKSRVTYEKDGASCTTYGPCKENAEVVLCRIKNHGHTWPGGPDNADGAKVCQLSPDGLLCKKMREYFGPVSQDISANDAMWEFFKKHPRAGAGEESSSTFGPGDYDFSLEHDGLTRTYKVHVPAQYDKNTPAPAVLYIHGGGGNARSAYLDKMDQASDKSGFILAIPEATGEVKFGELRGSWNGGAWATGECCGSADDVGFISKMIDEIKGKFNIDERRIYATGISNGGLMTNRLGCELSDKIAAIATVAPAAIPSGCKPQRPLPVMDIHGTADTYNPFYGGEPSGDIFRKVDYKRMTPAQVVGRWLDINGCVKEPDVSVRNSKVTYFTYAQCNPGSEVVFVKVENMGHAWPSGFESKFLGITPVSYDISFDQIWEFFRNQPQKSEPHQKEINR